MAQIELDCRRPDGRSVQLLLPADDIVATTLHINKGNESLPTLVTVEAVIGALANNGFVLADANQRMAISKGLNRFLSKPETKWRDSSIELRVDRTTQEQRDGLTLVAGLRTSTLRTARSVLDLGSEAPLSQQRTLEEQYVEEISEQVSAKNPQWSRYFDIAVDLIGKTVLQYLSVQLVGVPIVDIVRPIVRGAFRRVGD